MLLTSLLASGAWSTPIDSVWAPPQLNTSSFAICLRQALPFPPDRPLDLTAVRRGEDLSLTDGILVYLALYAGKRPPLLNRTILEPTFERWSVRFEPEGAVLAAWLQALLEGPFRVLTPGELLKESVQACASAGHATGDAKAFCGLIVSHNVLRALGRNYTYVDRKGTDYLPAWYLTNAKSWQHRAAQLERRMFTFRRDGNLSVVGEPWGTWYHTFGLLAYTVHEAAMLQAVYPAAALATMVALLNQLLNPILAGGKEDPAKAMIDRESAQIATAFAIGTSGNAAGACGSCEAYILPALEPSDRRSAGADP